MVTELSIVELTRCGLRDWIALSLPITLEMINQMHEEIEPLIQIRKDLTKKASFIDDKVRLAEAIREDARERDRIAQERREEERKKQQLVRELRVSHAALQSNISCTPILRQVRLSLERSYGGYNLYTLMAPSHVDLTSWAEDMLTKRERYLLIAPETGKLGWPALNKTRLTRFGTSLKRSGSKINAGGRWWSVDEIHFNMKLDTLRDWNVLFTLKGDEPASVSLYAKFSLGNLELVEIRPRDAADNGGTDVQALVTDFGAYSYDLCQALFKPFKYKKNSSGYFADDFCEGLSDSLILKLRSDLGQLFFSLESC